jgi:Peptidase family C50
MRVVHHCVQSPLPITACCVATLTLAHLQLSTVAAALLLSAPGADVHINQRNGTFGCAARRALARLPRCAAALLMGCSSGRLRGHGAYDPSGTVLAYLLAGEQAGQHDSRSTLKSGTCLLPTSRADARSRF